MRKPETATFWTWLPLLAALLSSYGPVAYNYGFALYFLNWKHGFAKRGLVGELFAGVSFLSRGQLLLIEFVFLAIAYAATYLVFRKIFWGAYADRVLIAVLLCAPAGLVHFGYLFAQPDVTLYLLTLISLAAWLYLPANIAVWIATGSSCIAMLGHEAYLLMFYPLLFVIQWRVWRQGRLRGVTLIASTLIVAVAFACILHFGKLAVSSDVILADAQQRTDVGIQRQVYDVMQSSLQQQLHLVRLMYSPLVIRILALTVLLSLPYWGLLVHLLRQTMTASGSRKIDQNVALLCFVAPLVLCIFGHDATRWIGAACLDITLFLLFLFATEERARVALRDWASQPTIYTWLAYFLLIGPYGATTIHAAKEIGILWP